MNASVERLTNAAVAQGLPATVADIATLSAVANIITKYTDRKAVIPVARPPDKRRAEPESSTLQILATGQGAQIPPQGTTSVSQ
jgi:hypothetical protein